MSIKKVKLLLACSLLIGFSCKASDIWVSDEIEAPLRAKPEMNSEITKMLPAGIKVKLIKTSANNGDYVQIETANGDKGWLSKYYILDKQTIHDKYTTINAEANSNKDNLAKTEAELKQKTAQLTELQTKFDQLNKSSNKLNTVNERNILLEKTIREQNNKIKQLSDAYEKANLQANDASVKYLSLSKVSENALDIEKQNETLQETNLKQEQELQLVKSENQEIKSKLNSNERLFGGLLVFGGLLIGYILSSIFPARRKIDYGSPL